MRWCRTSWAYKRWIGCAAAFLPLPLQRAMIVQPQLVQLPGSAAGSPCPSQARRRAGVSARHATRERASQPHRLPLPAEAAQNTVIHTACCQGQVCASRRLPRSVMAAPARAGDPFVPGCRSRHRAPASRVSALRASIPIAGEVSTHAPLPAALAGPIRNPWPGAPRAPPPAMSCRRPRSPRSATSP